jgi:hypothetical protein
MGTTIFSAVFLLGSLAIAGAQAMTYTPGVTVKDQTIDDARVVIADVVSAGPGWIVIHIDAKGSPGPVIGWAAVREGDNIDVTVAIDASKATPILYAMLHVDAGKVGVYEFPGADVPAMAGGKMVSPGFKAAPQAY